MHMLPFSRFAGYFVEVARLGNLRKAAAVLHVSASAIDRQILLAENELQTELFERLPSGLKLTAAGELLLNDVRRWRKEYARTTERLNDLQGLKRGHVSLAIIDALSEGVVARTLARLSESMPGLTFELRVLESCKIPDLIASAEVDFGLMLDPVEHAPSRFGLRSRFRWAPSCRQDMRLPARPHFLFRACCRTGTSRRMRPSWCTSGRR